MKDFKIYGQAVRTAAAMSTEPSKPRTPGGQKKNPSPKTTGLKHLYKVSRSAISEIPLLDHI